MGVGRGRVCWERGEGVCARSGEGVVGWKGA